LRSLNGRIDVIIDGGPAPGGLESTVLDLSRALPRLLRPGLIQPSAIEAIIGPIEQSPIAAQTAVLPSPGLLPRHYAPRAPLECVETTAEARVSELASQGLRVGWLTFGQPRQRLLADVIIIVMPTGPTEYAAHLYAALHDLDAARADRIVVELPPDNEEWLTVRDRLRRASA
jgi:L-threonylcarbamoyladenylate synthase